MESLRDQWAAGKTTLGLWASIPNPSTAEQLGRAGLDYVCIDNQHGLRTERDDFAEEFVGQASHVAAISG